MPCILESCHLLVGGGHGGKRSNAGRKVGKSTPLATTDWNKYKKMLKKESEKCTKSIHDFFTKGSAKVSSTEKKIEENNTDEVMSIPEDKAQSSKESEDELNNNECNQNDDLFPIDREAYEHIFKVGAIRFFKNGCFAPKDEKFSKSGSNYSCAIDSVLAMGEALLLSGNSESISYSMKFSPLLEEARKALSWRLDHDFHWNHSLRNSLWQYLATTFPQAYCPIGKVTAVVEPAVKDLEKLWFVEVIVDTVCSADDCGSGLGTFHLVCEELMLSSPKNCDLKNKQYNLPKLFLNRLSKHVNIVLGCKVRCTNKTCTGRARHTGIQYENLKVPSFLFLSVHVIGNSNHYFNDLKDSCTLDENIEIGSSRLNLLCSLMTSQLHFFSICKFFGKLSRWIV